MKIRAVPIGGPRSTDLLVLKPRANPFVSEYEITRFECLLVRLNIDRLDEVHLVVLQAQSPGESSEEKQTNKQTNKKDA